MCVIDDGIGERPKNREIKVFIKFLNRNCYLYIMKVGLEAKVVGGYDEDGRKFKNELEVEGERKVDEGKKRGMDE